MSRTLSPTSGDTGASATKASARLSDRVAHLLALEITEGRWPAGHRLPTEAQLVARHGVSRTVVREAVSRLKSLDLVESRQGSGVYVRPPARFAPLAFAADLAASKTAVLQILEVRRGLEGEMAALAAQRRTPTDLVRIGAAVNALNDAVRAGGDGVEEDIRFHRAIADAARNPILIATLEFLGQFLHDATRVTRADAAQRGVLTSAVGREHATIVRAVTLGDPARARQAAVRHMHNAATRLESAGPGFWHGAVAEIAAPLAERLRGQ